MLQSVLLKIFINDVKQSRKAKKFAEDTRLFRVIRTRVS